MGVSNSVRGEENASLGGVGGGEDSVQKKKEGMRGEEKGRRGE